MEHKTVVIDNGTGYTKMGYAGNFEPSYIIPTCIADCPDKVNHISYYFSIFSLLLMFQSYNMISLIFLLDLMLLPKHRPINLRTL